MRLYELTKFKRNAVDQTLPFDHPYDEHNHKKRLADSPWRGPHEGRIRTLMMQGLKPAALIQPEQLGSWAPDIEKAGLSVTKISFVRFNTEIHEVVVTQPGQEWRAKKIEELQRKRDNYERARRYNLWDAKMGMLLGYSNDDIRAYLNREDKSPR